MPEIETPPSDTKPLPRKRRKFVRIFTVMLLLLACGLVWLNGPGLRWLTPMVARHFLEKAGIRGDFEVKGSLTSGISIADLRLTGDKDLAALSVDRLDVGYRFSRLIKGEIESLTIDGVHADLRLGLEKPNKPKSPPLDLAKLTETIRSIRGRVLPISIQLKNISLAATREGKPAFALAASGLSHQRGGEQIQLDLGALTDPTGKTWPGQKSDILWEENRITVDRLAPFPDISLRNFSLLLPPTGEPSLETDLAVLEAVFRVVGAPGFRSADIDLREGKLDLPLLAKRFGVEIPASSTLTSLAISADGLLPDPKAATGTVRLLLENSAWKDWSASQVSLDASLLADKSTLVANIKALDTELSLNAEAPVSRDGGRFLLGDAQGRFGVPDVPRLIAQLAKRTTAIDPDTPVVPSDVSGNFRISFQQNKPTQADASLTLQAKDPKLATAVNVKGRWQNGQPLSAELLMDGLKAAAIYQADAASYQASLDLTDFTTTRIERWLAVAKIKPGGVANLSGNWQGSGEVKARKHRGEISFTTAEWVRPDVPPIVAIGGASYEWPGNVQTKGLRVSSQQQTLALDAGLANGLLELRRFLWKDAEKEIADGTASLPVPEDFSKWRETLSNDARPLAVSIQSRVLPLSLLKQWIPAASKIDPRSTGQLSIKLSGTYSDPVIDAMVEAKDLRSPEQPKLPPADLRILLAGRDGKLSLDATATAPDFPAATMKANLPFRPSDWAKDPALLKEENLDARIDLPRLDLSRFTTLVPPAEKITGFVTGNVTATGKLGKPVLKGELALTGGSFRFKDDRFPDVDNLSAAIDLALDKITLKSLKSTIAGGTLNGGGNLTLVNSKPANLDLSLRGDHLPIIRNHLLILRTNINLRLQGPWEKAGLSGTVGAVDSVFFRDIELLPIGTPFNTPSAAALPKIDPPKSSTPSMPLPFRDWALNVTVRTESPFLVRGNLATGDVNGSLRLGGTFGNPLPTGSFKLTDFRATLPFSTLLIRSGTVSFTPEAGFDPILEIRGTAEPRPYRITVYAYGRMSNPQLVLTSNPPLPDNEIMTLLATGTTTTGLENPQAASSRAMQLLAEELRRGRFRFGKQLRPLLGLLDRVDFSVAESDPYSNDSFSTATISLTDRWFVSAGLGGEGDSRVLAIWRLSFR